MYYAGAARAGAWGDYRSCATARGEGAGHSCSGPVQERSEMMPGGTIDHVLKHEVKKLGTPSLSYAGAARAGARGEGAGHSHPCPMQERPERVPVGDY